MEKWQIEWDSSEKGKELYKFCNKVGVDRLPLSFKGTQLLTGHGNLKGYLKRFGLGVGDGRCDCGRGEETGEHVRKDCVRSDRVGARDKMNGREWEDVRLRVGGKINGADVLMVNRFAEEVLEREEM